MSQNDLANRLKEAINLINSGQREEARQLLLPLSKQYPAVEQVWMWLATASDVTDDRIVYLKQVLKINPRNERARAAYTRLTGSPPPINEKLRPAPTASTSPARVTESYLIAILAIVVVIGIVLVASLVIVPALTPKPTATLRPSETPTETPAITYTPSITPGGPTFTPFVIATLPPTWTPAPTQTTAPTQTRLPTLTPMPTGSPTKSFKEIPSLTPIPTNTPATPLPATGVKSSATPRQSATPTGSATSATKESTITPTP